MENLRNVPQVNLTDSRCYEKTLTCNAKHESSKRDPALFLVSREVVIHVIRIEGFVHGVILLNNVVDPDQRDGDQPDCYNRRKYISNCIRTVSLDRKQPNKNDDRDNHDDICHTNIGNLSAVIVGTYQNGNYPVAYATRLICTIKAFKIRLRNIFSTNFYPPSWLKIYERLPILTLIEKLP